MRWCWLLVVTGCAQGGGNNSNAADAPCSTSTWYSDLDGDGHGDPTASVPGCTQPEKTAAVGDDCDDNDRFRYPGATEACDGLDTDCDPGSGEFCPGNCLPVQRAAPSGTYLFCNYNENWVNARMTCA